MKVLLGLFFLFCSSTFVTGHPAESVKMSFDSTGTILTIAVNHPVKTPSNHYISSIIVDINGKEQVRQIYSSQINKTEQIAIYKLFNIKKNDKINVTTQCNIMGKKKETIIYSFE